MAMDERLAPDATASMERARILEDARGELAKLVAIIRARRLGERVEGSVAFQAIIRALEAGATASVTDMLRGAALEVIRANGAKRKRAAESGPVMFGPEQQEDR